MKKEESPQPSGASSNKGYNEKNPGQPQGAFPPESHQKSGKVAAKSNAANKKKKEDQAKK